jgi:hypothetical protein
MTKSKGFWAVIAVISLAAAGFSSYSIYTRLAVQFACDAAETGPAPESPAGNLIGTKVEPAGSAEQAAAPPELKEPKEEPRKPKAVKTVFEYKSASAKSVALAGSFTKWKEARMTRKNGVWRTEVYILPGNYLYHFVADGKKALDPGKTKAPSGESIAVVAAEDNK